MVQRALDKKNIGQLFDALKSEGELRGPVADAQGTALGVVADAGGLLAGYSNFKLPVKRELFPQCEMISRYDAAGTTEAVIADAKTVLFGVRPCDAQSLAYLDKVFGGDPVADPYYAARRNNTLVISLACARPSDVCFCTSTGGSPAGRVGADIIAFDLDTSMLFESVSGKGEAFLKNNGDMLRDPTPAEEQAKEQQASAATAKLDTIPAKPLKEIANAPLWDAIAETCLSCGACTYLCPTCHCFSLYDDKQAEGGRRLRLHDACMFSSFVREASGHNPRTRPGDRMRQRIMHKFSYAPENFGDLFCVGCGRCIANCPSNIDIRETLSKVSI